MPPNQQPPADSMSVIAEAMRRMQGAPPSGAGIPGGMPATQQTSPMNPIAAAGQNNPQMPSQAPQGPLGQSPYQGQVQALGQADPNHAGVIIKSLVKALDRLIPEGEPTRTSEGEVVNSKGQLRSGGTDDALRKMMQLFSGQVQPLQVQAPIQPDMTNMGPNPVVNTPMVAPEGSQPLRTI